MGTDDLLRLEVRRVEDEGLDDVALLLSEGNVSDDSAFLGPLLLLPGGDVVAHLRSRDFTSLSFFLVVINLCRPLRESSLLTFAISQSRKSKPSFLR